MKKIIILSVAAIAVLFVSLTLNTNIKNSSSNINLGQLIQSASANTWTKYAPKPGYSAYLGSDGLAWAYTSAANMFGPSCWGVMDQKWYNGAIWETPDEAQNGAQTITQGKTQTCCLFGGAQVCSLNNYTTAEYVYDGEGNVTGTETISHIGTRWVGGNASLIMKY